MPAAAVAEELSRALAAIDGLEALLSSGVAAARGAQESTADLADLAAAYGPAIEVHITALSALREALAERYVPRVAGLVFAHGAAALGGRGAASAARVSRAWRAAAGPHGVVRAALGSEDADERVRGCKAVADNQ